MSHLPPIIDAYSDRHGNPQSLFPIPPNTQTETPQQLLGEQQAQAYWNTFQPLGDPQQFPGVAFQPPGTPDFINAKWNPMLVYSILQYYSPRGVRYLLDADWPPETSCPGRIFPHPYNPIWTQHLPVWAMQYRFQNIHDPDFIRIHVDDTLILGSDWVTCLRGWNDLFAKAMFWRGVKTPQHYGGTDVRDYEMLVALWRNFPGLTVEEMEFVMDMSRDGINALPQLLSDLRKQRRYNPTF
jgi:hypothetical protein